MLSINDNRYFFTYPLAAMTMVMTCPVFALILLVVTKALLLTLTTLVTCQLQPEASHHQQASDAQSLKHATTLFSSIILSVLGTTKYRYG